MTIDPDQPSEEQQKSADEREYESALKEGGWIITSENPEHRSGSMHYYRIEIAKVDDEDVTTSGQGVTRLDALKGALLLSKAK